MQLALMRHLIAAGYRVDLVLAQEGGVLLPLLPPQVRVIELRAQRLAVAFPGLVRYLRREKPWSLQAVMWPCTVIAVAARLAARSATRLILSEHTMLSAHYPGVRHRWALQASMSATYRFAEYVIAVSRGAADDVARLAGLPAAAVEVVHNPIDLPPTVAMSSASQKAWGDAAPRVISAGALKPEKNHELLLRAFARLLDQHGDARLLIVGDGVLRPRLEAVRDQLGLGERVIFAGFQIDPWPFYAGADLFALSSDNEGLPLVLVEALHAGLRVVSTDCAPGVREILDGERFGKVVPAGNEALLAAGMTGALREPSAPERQKARAQQLAGPAQFARYEELLANRERP